MTRWNSQSEMLDEELHLQLLQHGMWHEIMSRLFMMGKKTKHLHQQ